MSPSYRLKEVRYGYRVDPISHFEVPNAQEQATVKRVKALWAALGDLTAVRKVLWQEGYRNRKGNKMGSDLVRNIIAYPY